MSGSVDPYEAELVADDQLAIRAHLGAEASDEHRFLAQQIWHTAQALGAPPNGHVLATGLDAPVFVGTITPSHHERATSVWDAPLPWRATTPPRWPYPTFTVDPAPEPAGARARGPFVVQILAQVGLDVRARSMTAWSFQQRRFHEQLTHALTSAAPGGLVVTLANHMILDNPRRAPWEQAGQVADFLGAVRLPSHALRADARCDAPFDLSIFRTRPRTSTPDPGLLVPDTVLMQGGNLPISAYYRDRTDHMLGLPIVRTDRWDMEHLTLLDTKQTWRTRLPVALDQIARAHPPTPAGASPGIGATPPPQAGSDARPGARAETNWSPQAMDAVPPL